MRKTDFRPCKKTKAQISYCEADQRVCFCYRENTIPPLLIPKTSRLYFSSVGVYAGLGRTVKKSHKAPFSLDAAHLLF